MVRVFRRQFRIECRPLIVKKLEFYNKMVGAKWYGLNGIRKKSPIELKSIKKPLPFCPCHFVHTILFV